MTGSAALTAAGEGSSLLFSTCLLPLSSFSNGDTGWQY